MVKKALYIFITAALLFCTTSCKAKAEDSYNDYKEPKGGYAQLGAPKDGEEIAVITTNFGIIKVRFFPQYAPKAVENFVTHAKNGYYDGLIFHRVIDGFMIQGGDPKGNGTGGESIWQKPFKVEATPQLHHIRGALAMAKGEAAASIGSQFYIVQNKALEDNEPEEYKGSTREQLEEMLATQDEVIGIDNDGNSVTVGMQFQKPFIESYLENGGLPGLDYGYTVFGQTFEGFDVIDKIAGVETSKEEATLDRPLEDVIIESISIEKYKK